MLIVDMVFNPQLSLDSLTGIPRASVSGSSQASYIQHSLASSGLLRALRVAPRLQLPHTLSVMRKGARPLQRLLCAPHVDGVLVMQVELPHVDARAARRQHLPWQL